MDGDKEIMDSPLSDDVGVLQGTVTGLVIQRDAAREERDVLKSQLRELGEAAEGALDPWPVYDLKFCGYCNAPVHGEKAREHEESCKGVILKALAAKAKGEGLGTSKGGVCCISCGGPIDQWLRGDLCDKCRPTMSEMLTSFRDDQQKKRAKEGE